MTVVTASRRARDVWTRAMTRETFDRVVSLSLSRAASIATTSGASETTAGGGTTARASDATTSRWRRGALASESVARRRAVASPNAPARGYLEAKRRRRAVREAVARTRRRAEDAATRAANAYASREAEVGAVGESGERFARVGVLGAPNAGKSALVNALVGDKVSAVSRKTNTTRTRAVGVKTMGSTQIAFVDAPGIVGKEHYRNAAHARKVENAFEMAMDCDALAFVVDAARQLERRDLRVLQTMRRTRAFLREMASERGVDAPRAVLVLNKVDKVSRERRGDLMKIVEDVRADGGLDDFERVFPVSALTGAGTRALLDDLMSHAPTSPWEFDSSRTTDMTDARRALEIVRESVYNRIHRDLPYGVDIAHVSWEDFRNGDARIEQNILVDTASQRKIVVGRAGEVVGQIGINARVVLERALGRKVHLILNVRLKRKKNYRTDDVAFAENY